MAFVKKLGLLLLPLLLLTGCFDRSYSVKELHESRYWESTTEEILRAENYQDLVSIILYALEEHQEETTIRLYPENTGYAIAFALVQDACSEVRTETAVGSYLLHNLTFTMTELRESSYEIALSPSYRRTAEEYAAIVQTPSSTGVYELLLTAYEEGKDAVTVSYAHAAESPEELEKNILLLQKELVLGGPVTPDKAEELADIVPWEITFYPNTADSTMVEITFPEEPDA